MSGRSSFVPSPLDGFRADYGIKTIEKRSSLRVLVSGLPEFRAQIRNDQGNRFAGAADSRLQDLAGRGRFDA